MRNPKKGFFELSDDAVAILAMIGILAIVNFLTDILIGVIT